MRRKTNGPAIRHLREAYGITLTDFATRAGLDKSSLSRIETGDQQPTPATVKRIAGELGVPIGVITYPVPEQDAVA